MDPMKDHQEIIHDVFYERKRDTSEIGDFSLENERMSPGNQWLEDVYISYWNSPFLGDMLVFGNGKKHFRAKSCHWIFPKAQFPRKQELVGHVKNPLPRKNHKNENALGGKLIHRNRYPPEN